MKFQTLKNAKFNISEIKWVYSLVNFREYIIEIDL